jgi:NADH dehydrogenase FAD-containing subunit
VLLVGGGHAHVAVLADWITRGLPQGIRAVLLTPSPTLRYSGMVPGWIAGQHRRDEGTVNLAALAARAGTELILNACIGVDPDARVVQTHQRDVAFDIVSFDTGGVARRSALPDDEPRVTHARPIDALVDRLSTVPATARIIVAGGGAGGVELAFALRNRVRPPLASTVTLVTGRAGLLPDFAPSVQRRVAAALTRQGIRMHHADARLLDGSITAGDVSLEPADAIIAALGSAAPCWVRTSGLALDPAGFIAVDAHQQSLSHAHVFAAGDIAARPNQPVAHSGVHAVHAGPVLAANLRSVLHGQSPRAIYTPRRHSLYLLNTGDGSAIACYGPWSAEGRWVWRLKHWIDRRWIASYAALATAA